MKATAAHHQLGDLSSSVPDWCVVTEEDEDNYYGRWVLGMGFFNVRFPKATTHELTAEDERAFNAMVPRIRIGGLGHASETYGPHRAWPSSEHFPADLGAEIARL